MRIPDPRCFQESEEKEQEHEGHESNENEAGNEYQETDVHLSQFDETQASDPMRNRPLGNPLMRWAPQLVALHHPFLTEEERTLQDIVEKLESARVLDWRDSHLLDFCVSATTLYHCMAALQVGVPLPPFFFSRSYYSSRILRRLRKVVAGNLQQEC
jgi:hypothetical protein